MSEEPADLLPWPTAPWRAALLTKILAAALLSGLLLSPRLWLSRRSYPLAPVADFLPPVPPPLDALWVGTMVDLLAALILLPRRNHLLLPLLALAVASALWDQARWQPWFYQYLAMLGALAWADAKPDDPHRQEAALDVCRLVMAATYAWSGVQKVNASFVTDVWPWMLEPLPVAARSLPGQVGFLVPFVEAAIGVGLLLRRARLLAVAGAVVLHLSLLLLLGPTGHNWNSIVWPWNVAMIAMAFVLFLRTPEVTLRAILWPRRCPYGRLILLLFGVMPAASFIGLWDAYLSAALYSGDTLDAYVRFTPQQRERMPADVRARLQPDGDEWLLDLSAWSSQELNVPAYPARRVARRVTEELAGRAEPPTELELVISEQPGWRRVERRETTYRCAPRK